jgi:hypothetical protein
VADLSALTVRIESVSTSDLNVQDVSSISSLDDADDTDDDIDADDELRRQSKQHKQSNRLNSRSSFAVRHRHGSNKSNPCKMPVRHKHPTRINTDAGSSMRVLHARPITAVSLPAKTSAYDNDWDLDNEQAFVSNIQRRNPSCPSISSMTARSKTPSPSRIEPKLILQHAPTIFTTTSECLGNIQNIC